MAFQRDIRLHTTSACRLLRYRAYTLLDLALVIPAIAGGGTLEALAVDHRLFAGFVIEFDFLTAAVALHDHQ